MHVHEANFTGSLKKHFGIAGDILKTMSFIKCTFVYFSKKNLKIETWILFLEFLKRAVCNCLKSYLTCYHNFHTLSPGHHGKEYMHNVQSLIKHINKCLWKLCIWARLSQRAQKLIIIWRSISQQIDLNWLMMWCHGNNYWCGNNNIIRLSSLWNQTLGLISQSTKIHLKMSCQYHHCEFYCDITHCLAVNRLIHS